MLERVTCYFLFHFRWAPAKDYGFLYGGLQPVVLSRPSRSYIIARPSEHELMFHSIYPLRTQVRFKETFLHRPDLPH